MSVDHIRYDILAQDALRGVVRTVLTDAAAKGMPGEHHFLISFDPRAEGVRMSDRLRSQYPEEMTIVLQHQFWDLIVNDEGFEVGLSFGGVPERLAVPFEAIKGFFDPSVQFGLQFETIGAEAAAENKDETGGDAARILPAPANPEKGGNVEPPAPPDGGKPGAEVVRLDRFRKK